MKFEIFEGVTKLTICKSPSENISGWQTAREADRKILEFKRKAHYQSVTAVTVVTCLSRESVVVSNVPECAKCPLLQ